MPSPAILSTSLAVLLSLCVAGGLAAAESGTAQPGARLTAKPAKGSDRAKLPSHLLAHLDDRAAGRAVDLSQDAGLRQLMVAAPDPQQLTLTISAVVSDGLLAQIRETGAEIVFSSPRWKEVVVHATLAQADALSHLAAVRKVALALKPRVRQSGAVANHGDTGMNTDALRTFLGVTGASVKVGVLSDSVRATAAMKSSGAVAGSYPNAVMTGTPPQVSGDLPAELQLVGDDPATGNTDEGEGMLEIVHDVAPGSPLAFAPAGASQSQFAANILALKSAGCKVIVDDIIFFAEPMFQDGPVAQAADAVRNGGGLYFSAAGNEGDQGIQADFVDLVPGLPDNDTTRPNGNDFHNWGLPGTGVTPGFLPLTVPGNGSIMVLLQWNQPFESFNLGDGSEADLDLFLYSRPDPSSTVLDYGFDAQGSPGSPFGDPVDYATYSNPSSTPVTIYLAVSYYSGTLANRFHVVVFGDVGSPNYATHLGKSTIYGHGAAKGAVAVGAIFADSIANPSNKGPYGGDPTRTCAETFSSKGGLGAEGLQFFYDTTGARLAGAPQLRDKPEIAAPDGVQTLLFGSDYPAIDPAHPTFFGTSAAAPNAAAAAALVWDADPTQTNEQVLARLVASATDIVASLPASGSGPDAFTGAGLINAAVALPTHPVAVRSQTPDGAYVTGTITIDVTFSAPVTVGGSPTLALNTNPAHQASFASATGRIVTFTYPIQRGDMSERLDYTSAIALDLNGGTIVDGAGNPPLLVLPDPGTPNSLAGQSAVAIVAGHPTPLIVPAPALGRTAAFSFTVAFPVPVTGFDPTKLSVTNGSIGAVTAVDSMNWLVPVTATAPGTVRLSAQNALAVSANGMGTYTASGSATYDPVAPTVTLSPSARTAESGQPVAIDIRFSEPVSGFDAAHLTVSGATAGALSGSGTRYTLVVTFGDGEEALVTLAAAGIGDGAGNPLTQPATARVAKYRPPEDASACSLGSIALVLGLPFLLLWRRRRA